MFIFAYHWVPYDCCVCVQKNETNTDTLLPEKILFIFQ